MQSQRLTLMRLHKQQASFCQEPMPNAMVVRDGLLNFHFCLFNLQGSYSGGFYHGVLQLHQNYPFAAPNLIFYTPNGRFQTNKPICTSFTSYHQESWTSAWNVRTLILATISFMYSEEPSYGCSTDPDDLRKEYAKNSLDYNKANDKFVNLFGEKLIQINIISKFDLKNSLDATQAKKLRIQNAIALERQVCLQRLFIMGSGVIFVIVAVNFF